MTKEKFKYLYSFKYDNKDYIYLFSRNYPFYFLEYNFNTNNFEYPDIDTFKDLYNKFYSNDKLYFKYDLKKIKQVLLDLNFDVIFVDPHRKGCDKEFIETIMNSNINRIVYVSCDPKSLVRDLSLLKEKYEIKKVSLVDMFANSTHIESIVLLELKK